MNISPTTLLVIIIVSVVANVLYVLVVRSRGSRARHAVEIDGIMSSSYVDLGSDDGWPAPAEPAQRAERAQPSEGWASRDLDASAEAPPADPLEFPAPTALEQRASLQDESDMTDAAPGAPSDSVDEAQAGVDVDVEGHGADAAVAVEGSMDAQAVGETATNDEEGEVERMDAIEEHLNGSSEMQIPPAVPGVAAGRSGTLARGRDPLTGLLDALSFEDAMAKEDAREQRYRHSATVIVFELDGLAKLVDRLGTDPGDRIEAALSDTISRLARQADYVARLDRGRYAVLLPETDEVAAINYVERIRRACDLWLESGAIAMRLAIGWASTGGDNTLDGALRTATDRMRLELRRNGRAAGDVSELPLEDEASGF